MFGTRITTVFQSRWKAVTWSLGILATAYCSVPSADETAKPAEKVAASHHSPWDKDR
jgi:hypothetical protein